MSGQALTISIVLMAFCVLASAFFSSAEAAYLRLQKVRLLHLVSSGKRGAKGVEALASDPARLLATVLLGNNFVNTAFSAIGTVIVASYLGERNGAIVSTLAISVLLLVLGEAVPKSIAVAHPERVAFLYLLPMTIVERAFAPVARVLQWLSAFVVRLLGQPSMPVSFVTEEEIRTIISQGQKEGAVDASAAEMLEKVFRFQKRQVREVMVPRTEVIWVNKGTTYGQLRTIFAKHYHTRFPVRDPNTDDVVGILSIKDAVRARAASEITDEDDATRVAKKNIVFVPETRPVDELFQDMRKAGTQMAMVVDEFGSIAGLVTLKQLVEEIVGKVAEDSPGEEQEVRHIDERTLVVDAGMSVLEANEQLALGIPQGEYETLAGFVLSELRHIPQEKEQLRYKDLRITVQQMKGVKIESLRIVKG